MRHLTPWAATLLLSSLTLPAAALTPVAGGVGPTRAVAQQLARGGGGGRLGGGAAPRSHTGFAAPGGGFNRGTIPPAGGWSSRVPADRATPSLNRTMTRNWGGTVNLGDVNLRPGWARPGWALARPWPSGWYGGWARPAWGWWGARAAAWGITTLATASVINAAVDAAVENQVDFIVVPDTALQLLYGTVQPSGSSGVSFVVTDGGNSYRLTADCKEGSLNGAVPSSAAEAELVNAACQVAYGAA